MVGWLVAWKLVSGTIQSLSVRHNTSGPINRVSSAPPETEVRAFCPVGRNKGVHSSALLVRKEVETQMSVPVWICPKLIVGVLVLHSSAGAAVEVKKRLSAAAVLQKFLKNDISLMLPHCLRMSPTDELKTTGNRLHAHKGDGAVLCDRRSLALF